MQNSLLLLLLFSVVAHSQERSKETPHKITPTQIPLLARIAGVSVGFDTMEKLERRLGHGLPMIGGHPNGQRVWVSQQANWQINADGFGYNHQGRVIDEISIGSRDQSDGDSSSAKIPRTRVARSRLLFMGVVPVGMGRAEVMRLLKSRLPAPKEEKDVLIWTAKGFVQNNRINHMVKTLWTAELHFERGRLDWFTLSAD